MAYFHLCQYKSVANIKLLTGLQGIIPYSLDREELYENVHILKKI